MEARIGRTLTKHDFLPLLINDLNYKTYRSGRLLTRLTTTQGEVFGANGLIEIMVNRMLANPKLSPEQRARLRERWHAMDDA